MNDDVEKERDQIIAEDLVRIDAMSDDDIDFSDIPEMTDEQWSRAVRGTVYQPVKERESVRDDPSVDARRPLSVLEPDGGEAVAGMDVDLPEHPGTGVDEGVRQAGRRDHDLAAGDLDRLLPEGVDGMALDHHEHFLIVMPVQLRPLSWLELDPDERDADIAEAISLELAAVGQVGPVDHGWVVSQGRRWRAGRRGARRCSRS